MQDNIKLATRESPLALRQANIVREYLLDNNVFNKIDIVASLPVVIELIMRPLRGTGVKAYFLKN